MQKLPCLLLAFLLWNGALNAQQLVSSTLLGVKTQAQLIAELGVPFIQYGARYYKVTYTTPDIYGVTDTASALVAVPNDPTRVFPRLVYQHGTSSSKSNVPSNYGQPGGDEGGLALLFAGLGYVALAPDYLGLGDSRGFHPYVHAESEAWVALDLLRALPEFALQEEVHFNDQLFLTGYSQGGHASMALHRAIEQDATAEFDATAAAHLSGPYSIGEVFRDVLVGDQEYDFPGYIMNTALSYQLVYGNLFDSLPQIFKPDYVPALQLYFDGQMDLGTLNGQLITKLVVNEGAVIPSRMVQPAYLQEVLNDPNHPVNVALRDNNVYQWAPEAPTRLYYCQADDQVPYLNSIVANDTMKARGAALLATLDVGTTLDHGQCVVPALTNTVFFFAGFQQISTYVGTDDDAVYTDPYAIWPNPASEQVFLSGRDVSSTTLEVFDSQGRLTARQTFGREGLQLQTGHWERGLYFFRLSGERGVFVQKVFLR